MDVEGGCLEAGKPVIHRREGLLYLRKTLQSFFEVEVRKVIAARFDTEERPELLVLLDKSMLAIGPEYVMTLLDTVEGGMELPGKSTRDPVPEEGGDRIGTHRRESAFTGARDQAITREMTMEDHIARPLDRGDEGVAAQTHAGSLFPGKLRSEQEGPVVDALPNTFGGEPATGTLEEGSATETKALSCIR